MLKLLITITVAVSLILFVLTQFTYKKQPTEVLNPGKSTVQQEWCFSSWCGDGWTNR